MLNNKFIKYFILVLFLIILFERLYKSRDYNPLLETKSNFINFSKIHLGNINDATKYTLSIADSILYEIISVKKKNQTFENTLLKLDYIYNCINNIWNITSLFSSVHPDPKIREEADTNDLIIQEYMMKLSINEELYNCLKLFSDSEIAQSLSMSRKRFLKNELRVFKSSGLHLPLNTRKELVEINKQLADLSIEFSNNITSNTDSITFSEDMLQYLLIRLKLACTSSFSLAYSF